MESSKSTLATLIPYSFPYLMRLPAIKAPTTNPKSVMAVIAVVHDVCSELLHYRLAAKVATKLSHDDMANPV